MDNVPEDPIVPTTLTGSIPEDFKIDIEVPKELRVDVEEVIDFDNPTTFELE
jgi:hypothetical protein